MCGIVGLHLRNPEIYPRLGELLTGMLCEMEERGADSAGVAVYGDPVWSPAGRATISLLELEAPAPEVASGLGAELGAEVTVIELGGTYLVQAGTDSLDLLAAARKVYPKVIVGGFGEDLAVIKGVGRPRDLARSWGLAGAAGWQGVGHTRMATESAVTAAGAHPYAVGPGQCITARSPIMPPSAANCGRPERDSTRRTTPRSAPASSPAS